MRVRGRLVIMRVRVRLVIMRIRGRLVIMKVRGRFVPMKVRGRFVRMRVLGRFFDCAVSSICRIRLSMYRNRCGEVVALLLFWRCFGTGTMRRISTFNVASLHCIVWSALLLFDSAPWIPYVYCGFAIVSGVLQLFPMNSSS